MSLYDHLRRLPVAIDAVRLEQRRVTTSTGWERVTTIVIIAGGGLEGRGEDVTYDASFHDTLADRPAPRFDTAATLHDHATRVCEGTDEPYTQWAFASALLSLALGQAGSTLGDVVGAAYRPVRFVISPRTDPITWHAAAPALEYKLDAVDTWTDAYIDELAATGRVRVVDLKAHYAAATGVNQAPDERLYRSLLDRFDDDTTIEDPWVADGFVSVLAGNQHRVSFDAPIHSVADIRSLPFEPGRMNIKPSRFGSVEALLEAIEYCISRGIVLYGGGQFELDCGRTQIQEIASLFYPDGPNDVAPGIYNTVEPQPGLPPSPLDAPNGFAATAVTR